ncbi:hypothetical protein F4818DRAFT_91341 [Hypoxylon cercidicola]|nr:hypothetical protein F4818DRAFT_91341 [Hypoxylon cercidicola]
MDFDETSDKITCSECNMTDNFYVSDDGSTYCKHCGHVQSVDCDDRDDFYGGSWYNSVVGETIFTSSPALAAALSGQASMPFSDSGYASMPRQPLGQNCPKQGQANPHEHISNEHNDDEDVKTVYTDVSGPSDMWMESYIFILAEDIRTEILKKTGAERLDDQTVERLSSILPELLKALALKFGYEAPSQTFRDVMVFIHRHRDAIATSFRDNHCPEDISDTESSCTREPPTTEVMDRWESAPMETDYEDLPDQSNDDEFGSSDDIDLDIPGLEEYKTLIFQDPSYAWLLDRLHMEMTCSKADPDISRDIREAILQAIPMVHRISRKECSYSAKVVYTIDWQILAFLHSQDYGIPNSEAIASAITLTGSQTDAQALSCCQYMAQIWPSTGAQTLRLIQEMLKTEEHKKKLIFHIPSKLELESWIDGTSVVVSAVGIPDFVGEIGEQLAWLGAAFRPSPVDGGIALCTPYVDCSNGPSETRCIIKYRDQKHETNSHQDGQCWHHLFANPTIVQGFPTLRRAERDTGLEAPLDMLVSLAGARYIDTFKSKVFIKGFSTMLVPTRQSEDSVVWHLLYNEDPSERISYLDCGLEHADVQIPQLEQCRHILGWCSNAVSIVGTTQASYNISRSNLPNAYSGCALEKAEISGGQFVTGTAGFKLGNKEKPVHISRFGYFTKLQWISSKYFVFWDEKEKRGWLVDGASALLHILRASLEYSKRKFQSAWLLDPGSLTDPNQLTSALEVLVDERNRDLKLYIDKTEVFDEETKDNQRNNKVLRRQTRHYRLEDRIEHIYNILEKLIDHQTDVERRPGLQINIRPRRQLEGWDFKDLATDGDPFFPRVATLQTIGKGWVDFTRTIHAVTLFGQGFGELIQPQFTTATLCPRWSILPSERYYLAALVSDLYEIMEKYGDSTSDPRKLCGDIIWHMKEATFRPCPCARGVRKCHDPVQTLFPSRFQTKLAPKSHIALQDQGAVIFGHNMSLHWHWKDSGDPVKGDPPPQLDVALDTFCDSGLGSSLSSSGSCSTPDPNSIAATGSNVPSPSSSTTLQGGSPERAPEGSKRPLRDMISSISKRTRI